MNDRKMKDAITVLGLLTGIIGGTFLIIPLMRIKCEDPKKGSTIQNNSIKREIKIKSQNDKTNIISEAGQYLLRETEIMRIILTPT